MIVVHLHLKSVTYINWSYILGTHGEVVEEEEWLYCDDDFEKLEVQHTEGECNKEKHAEGECNKERAEGQNNEEHHGKEQHTERQQTEPQQVSV